MEGSHIPNQPNPRFGFVQNPGGMHYGSGIDTGQNLSTPGQSLPPPPPLVRHGNASSSATTSSSGSSASGSMGSSMGNSVGSSMGSGMGNSVGSSVGSGMGNSVGSSMGSGMGNSVGSSMGNSVGRSMGSGMGNSGIPNQSNTRFRYQNPAQTGAQQYGPNWRGPNMRHPGTVTKGQNDQMLRQALGHEYNISLMQQDKQTNFAVSQGQGQFHGVTGQGYMYRDLTNALNVPGALRERIDPRFPSSCRMPTNTTQNVAGNMRKTGQSFAPNFNNFTEMQRAQGYGSNTNQYSLNQGVPMPPPAHQNGPRMPPPAHQQQSGTLLSHGQGHIGVNSRQAQVSSAYGMVSQAQGHYVGASMQVHISQGQGHVGMSSGQGYISQGQNTYSVNQVQRGQDLLVQGQSNFQGQGQQRTRSVSGGQGIPSGLQNQERFVKAIEAAASLAQLSNTGDSESKLRLLHLKDKLEKSGMLGPGESLPSFLAKYALREKNRFFVQQQQAHANNPNMPAQTPVSGTVSAPAQSVKGQADASAIQSAFVIPQSHEAQDKAVLGRWYAPPSAKTGLPTQTPGLARSPLAGQSVTMATATATTSVSSNMGTEATQATGEPFVLKPTVCNEEVIEYKVADLLRCLPQSVRSRHTSSVDSNKSTGQSICDTHPTLNQDKNEAISDQSQQRERPTSPMHTSESPVRSVEKETHMSGLPEETVENEVAKTASREGTPGSDELGTNSLDINKQKLFDELVLDSQFGTQDMNPDIDFRNYLPSPGLPADFSQTPSPVIRETESPFVFPTSCQTDTDSSVVTRCQSPELSGPSEKELDINTLQDTGEKEPSVETEVLPKPTVEIDRDESPVRISKKRKLSSVSDSNLGKLPPPLKRQRGRGRGRAHGRGTKARGKGRSWAVNLTPNSKQNKPVRGLRKQTARLSRGRGRGGRAKPASVTEVYNSPAPKIEQSESPSVAGLDGQVIQKPQDLKKLMDNLPHEELEKTTVSLSTLKMMLAWSEAKENAGPEDDEDSDTVSVTSAGDAENQVKEMETQDVSSEINNKEHNRYEPPAEGVDESSREGMEEESESENKETTHTEKEKQNVEVKSPAKVLVDKLKDVSAVTETNEIETNEDQNKDHVDTKRSEERKEVDESKTIAVIESQKTQEENASKDDLQVENINSEPSNIESPSSTQVYSVTDTHKMTWVRYHGKTVTQLITPDGNFFIMKEILRRCFRIQEPNKSLKFGKIGILKRKVLKIPDIELEPLFYDYVVKNLVERKVIRTIPQKFIIISEEDANKLFHYVCKDQYCGSACVTPFIQSRAATGLKHSEMNSSSNSSAVSDISQTKPVVKKDRNLFDFLEKETVSPKVEKGISDNLPKKKRQKHPSSEVINLCSDEEDSNGYDTDKTLPYIDGKPTSFAELKEMDKNNTKCLTENEIRKKETSCNIKKASSDSNGDVENVLQNETGDTSEKLNKSKSESDKTETAESQDSDSGNNRLNKCNSGKEILHTNNTTDETDTTDLDNSAADKSPIERNSENLNKNCDIITEGKSPVEAMNNSHGSNTKEIENNKVSDDEVIVIEDEEEDNSFSEENETGVCKLTLDRMKKEIGLGSNIDPIEIRRESVELVQVHNIDSTAVCADNSDRSDTGKSDKQKLECGERGIKMKTTSAIEKEICDIVDISAVNDKCIRDVDNAIKSDRTVDLSMDIDLTADDEQDVTIGEWVFPAPPKTYPQDGTKKLEEAKETLDKIIVKANNAKKTEEFVEVLDTVFKLTEPLKQWTNTLLDHYEEGLQIEAQRLRSLNQLKLMDISNTIELDDDDDDDVEMD
ncbi:uncharacterized protein LOC123566442 isoform X2 [Mercenaria mercenaria]|uniref:uncharacterized protein LOC123566442 isoform X2 n=1 Tax=Mercenaria mercenaria TaxID=6596 RepID=UPI00234F5266|nr:uncharacterized protein LOC123566442 isoform X2 [Mercenaria mercenaria]